MNLIIKHFFDELDYDIKKYPEMLATDYILYCFDYPSSYEDVKVDNVLSVPNNYSLNKAIMRGLMMTPSMAIIQQNNQPTFLGSRAYSNQEVERKYIYCPSLDKLGQWLADAKKLLIDGRVVYIPNGFQDIEKNSNSKAIVIGNDSHVLDILRKNALNLGINASENYIQTYGGKPLESGISREIIPSKKVADFSAAHVLKLIDSTNQVMLCSSSNINLKSATKLLSIEIPIMDSSSMDTFSNVLLRNPEPFDHFSNYLHSKVLELKELDRDHFDKVSIDIKQKCEELKYNIKKNRRDFYTSTAQVVTATVAANLYMVNFEWLSILQAVMGGSATGIASEIPAIHTFMEQRRANKNNPMFFLWVLGKHK